jgi:glyoxylase-like metal-dependent hydrolase (beta-lactamase superfamily II)/rhodanese-related sulfurtransferase
MSPIVRGHTETATHDVSPQLLKEALDTGAAMTVLDVRDPDEYASWRIPGSVNMPERHLRERVHDLPRHREIVTVCLHGVRSARATRFLLEQGYAARTMAGGMVAWNSVYDVADVPTGSADIQVLQFRRLGKGCVSYLLGGRGEAFIIDPTIDSDVYLREAEARGLHINAVIDTHIHADHVSGGWELTARTGTEYSTPIVPGGKRIGHGTIHLNTLLSLGGALLRVIATPGHTRESVTYVVEDLALTGDTLFTDSVGRPDLGENTRSFAATLWDTLHNVLGTLPTETRVLPAHVGESTRMAARTPVTATIGEIQKTVSAFRMAREEFVAWVVENTPEKPPNVETIKGINLGLSPRPAVEDIRELEAGPNRCAVPGPEIL